MSIDDLTAIIDSWESCTLAQRLDDARLLLKIKGYLRYSESERIKKKIAKDWDKQIKQRGA